MGVTFYVIVHSTERGSHITHSERLGVVLNYHDLVMQETMLFPRENSKHIFHQSLVECIFVTSEGQMAFNKMVALVPITVNLPSV